MYVIIDSNDNNRIVLGPMEWRPKYFSLVLSDEYDQEIAVSQGSANLVPFEIISGVVIRECDTSYPSIDPDIEDYSGPSWTVHANGSATAVWGKVDKPLHIIKDNYLAKAAAERYNKETTSFKVVIGGKEYTQITSRDDRGIFILLMNSILTPNKTLSWKFVEGFVDLAKADVTAVLTAYVNHVQTRFDWEKTKLDTIKASTTKEQIKVIEIAPPKPKGF